MPYPLTRTGTYRTINKLHTPRIMHHSRRSQPMNHAMAVSSIANKRICLTREDVCAAAGRYRLLAIAAPFVHVALQRQDEIDT
jgi:hypothetical protein